MRLKQLRNRWWLIRHHGDALNRRVKVENYLLKAAAGKEPLPDAAKCRELAYELGIPSSWRQP